MGGGVGTDVERRRAAWQSAVREMPEVAKRFGPPNWLVMERSGGDPAKFVEMAVKMRAELDVPETPTVPEKSVPDQMTVPGPCEDCGLAPKAQYRKVCGACHAKAMRQRGEEA